MNKSVIICAFAIISCVRDRVPEPATASGPKDPGDRILIHYWNFNNSSSLTQPSFSVGGASISVGGVYDAVTPGTLLNARRGDLEGSGLRVRNPSTNLIINSSMKGYERPLFSFSCMRTNNGAKENIVSYSLDGKSYTTDNLVENVVIIDTLWQIYSFDFANVTGAKNNPDFSIKITFNSGQSNTTGNDRYDNITLEAAISNLDSDTNINLIHYWNFNNNTSYDNLLKISKSELIGASIKIVAPPPSAVNIIGGSGQNFSVLNLNARNSDSSGTHLRFDNPIGGSIEFSLPTKGYRNLILKFSTRRSGQGAGLQYWSFSSDGINYIPHDTVKVLDSDPSLQKIDFSKIVQSNDNSNFKIKVTFAQGDGGLAGNNRFDNITLEGIKF